MGDGGYRASMGTGKGTAEIIPKFSVIGYPSLQPDGKICSPLFLSRCNYFQFHPAAIGLMNRPVKC